MRDLGAEAPSVTLSGPKGTPEGANRPKQGAILCRRNARSKRSFGGRCFPTPRTCGTSRQREDRLRDWLDPLLLQGRSRCGHLEEIRAAIRAMEKETEGLWPKSSRRQRRHGTTTDSWTIRVNLIKNTGVLRPKSRRHGRWDMTATECSSPHTDPCSCPVPQRRGVDRPV